MISGPKFNGAMGLVLKAMAAWVTAPYLLKQRVPEIDRRHQELKADVCEVKMDIKAVKADLAEVKEGVAYIKGQVDQMNRRSSL